MCIQKVFDFNENISKEHAVCLLRTADTIHETELNFLLRKIYCHSSIDNSSNNSSSVNRISLNTWRKIIGKYVVVYDGVCILCDHVVNLILKLDNQNNIIISSSSDTTAKELICFTANMTSSNYDSIVSSSIIVMDPNGRLHIESDAFIELCMALGGWGMIILATLMSFIPKHIRDIGYRVVSRYRFKLFGQLDECKLPTPEIKQKYL